MCIRDRSGGLHGVGVSCVNALSSYLRAEVHREGVVFEQEYSQGKPKADVKEIGKTDKTGTNITFKPDPEIFEVEEYKYETLLGRTRELSFLNKGLHLTLTDERETDEEGNFKSETFISEGGLMEFVQYLDANRQKLIETPIYVTGKEDNVEIEVAMTYNTSFAESIHSYVNNINTREGGTHVSGFRRAVNRVFKQYGDDNGFFKKLKFNICLLYTSPSPRDATLSRMPSSA